MTAPVTVGLSDKLAVLQKVFKLRLVENISEIDQLWVPVRDGIEQNSTANVTTLHRIFHSLAGAGGTFGAIVVSRISRELELKFKSILDDKSSVLLLTDSSRTKIGELIDELRNAESAWTPSVIPFIRDEKINNKRENNLIFLAEDDALLAVDLVEKLIFADYEVRHFLTLETFEAALKKEDPAVIIMDIVFKEGSVAGADIINKITKKYKIKTPVIFISVRDDIESRLAAARAGARRYFCKPLDANKLILTIDGLTARIEKKPYRVLLVDDDESLLKYYEVILSDAGMVVKAISNPLDGLHALNEFKPDVMVLDVYMPECSGPELAQVIRQDDAWAFTPIMFLSSETDLDKQLVAMSLGADDFLVKPVSPGHFSIAVTARAQRSRWTNRLNRELVSSLRESEFQLVTLNQHNIVSITDVMGKIISVNQKFCETSEYGRNELLGRNHSILKSGLHPKAFYSELWGTISSGKVWHGTVCNLSKNGEEYWVEVTIVPFLDENGKPYKYVSNQTNVTALRESEERLRRSQVCANIGTWDWNIRTGGLYWSDVIWPLFGYEKDKTKTTYENFIAAIHPDDRQLVIDAVNNCIENGVEYNIEHRVIWHDGTEHWVQESGDVIRSEDNVPLHMLGVVQAIDRRKDAQQALTIAREEAENANQAKSQFFSRMSHELRTPMNAIMGYGQLMKMDDDQPLSQGQQESVNEILSASAHLLDLINDVLDLAKIEAGQMSLKLEPIYLGEVVVESLQLISPLAQKRGIEISLKKMNKEIDLEKLFDDEILLQVDRTRLKQVLLNLLSNAVKYNSENGKITLSCDHVKEGKVRIAVTDTGDGLSDDQQTQLFDSFERLSADQSDIEGTGIGLVITKNIVELMGGSIGVNSRPNEGCTFWVEFNVSQKCA